MLYKNFEIWQDNLGRWCVYNTESLYSRESDHKIFGSLKDAKRAIDNYIKYGCFES